MKRLVAEELVTGLALLGLAAFGYGMSHTGGLFWSFLALVGTAALVWGFYFHFRR